MSIVGDFNKDLLNSQINNNWTDYMYSQGLILHVIKPTRVVPNRTSTLIDHVYSTFSDNIKYAYVPEVGLSDYYPISLQVLKHLITLSSIYHSKTLKISSLTTFRQLLGMLLKSLRIWVMH